MAKSKKKERDLGQFQSVLPPQSVGYRCKLLAQLMSRKLQDALLQFKITPLQYIVLACLWQEDGLPTSSITRRLKQLGGTMTGVLDGLERRGLITRERDAEDRRVSRIWLTEAGDRLHEKVLSSAIQVRKEVFAPLTASEVEAFSDLIDRLINHLS